MTRVVLSGYYGFGNTGDELVLWSIIEQLRSLEPDLDITVLSGDPMATMRDYGVRAVPRMNPLAVASALRRADLLISGGGSLLQDVTSGRTVPYYLGIVSLAQALNVPVFFYAQGIGPLSRHNSREMVRRVVSKVAAITVRDAESAELLSQIGVEGPPVGVTADPVFGLDVSRIVTASADTDPRLAGLPGPRFAFAIRPWPARPGWKGEVAGAARRCAEEFGASLVWLAFHPPGDEELARELQELAGREPSILVVSQAPKELFDLLGQVDLVVGMRLHALIAAAIAARPFVGLSYDPKVENLLDRFGLGPARPIGEVTEEGLLSDIRRVWRERDTIMAGIATVVESLRAMARDTASQALSVARKRGA